MRRTIVIVIVTIVVAIVALFVSKTAISSAPELMPKEVKVENFSYISGGIGESESIRMKSLAKTYQLEIVFIQRPIPRQSEAVDVKEEYLSNIQLLIQDHHLNPVLNLETDGPYLLVNLASGRYLLVAGHHGLIKQQWVNVSADKHQRVVFWWPI